MYDLAVLDSEIIFYVFPSFDLFDYMVILIDFASKLDYVHPA